MKRDFLIVEEYSRFEGQPSTREEVA